jgi:hypothetical protein
MVKWKNPILFGAAIMSHPCDDPGLLQRSSIRKILVPGEWMRKMCEPFWGEHVEVWPVGIDTEWWTPINGEKSFDFLIYDKVRWEHDRYEKELIDPIRTELRLRGLSFREIRYGFYQEEEFLRKLSESRAMIFLCEHETQGLAYQQALSCGVPILAWDRGGFWQDPSYYPHKVKFGPVSSVPYWDDRCGMRFEVVVEFPRRLMEFSGKLDQGGFQPRSYILENLTLEKCAGEYEKKYLKAQGG